jgi:hypothetical protein
MVGHHGVMNRVRITPRVPGQSGRSDTQAHFDMVLVQTDRENESTNGIDERNLLDRCVFFFFWLFHAYSHRVIQVCCLFTTWMPPHFRTPASEPALSERLAYIEWFTPFRAPHPHSKLRSVERASELGRSAAAEIIPISLMPQYDTSYRAEWATDSTGELFSESLHFRLVLSISTIHTCFR